jgi:formylglycine-generating enzyme required for sulfatase activity/lysophospholipase L1-like esterase
MMCLAAESATGGTTEGIRSQLAPLVYTNWPFDQAEARERQKATATQLGWPERKTIALPAGESLELVLVPAGEFVMGRNPEGSGAAPTMKETPHRVRISRPFYLGKTEFSQGQWQALTGANPASFTDGPDRARLPVDSVSYTAIQDSLLPRFQPLAPAGWRFRLPTEAEWEYACRAGSATAFSWGADIATNQARFNAKEPAICGQFPANAWGLHDMHGNLWEWCLDWKWDSYYTNSPSADPVNVKSGWSRVVRGGCWASAPAQLDAAFRGSFTPDIRFITRYMRTLGFRLALIPDADRDPVGLAMAAAAKVPPAPLGEPALFQDGDRVCFVGDSITRGGGYHTFIRLYYLTRFPDRDIRFFNCGISGDNATRAYDRVDWDVTPHRPTVCTVMFGMNDLGKYSNYGRETSDAYRRTMLEEYYTKLSDLGGRLADLTPRLVFLTSSPFDEVVTSPTPVYGNQVGRNLGLAEGAKTVASVARRGASFLPASYVDFFTPMNSINEERQKTDKSFTLISPDRVHPGPVGHFVMACTFLKAQRAPAMVSRLVLDAAGGKIEATENCEARELVSDGKGVRFQLLEKALPFPVPEEAAPALDMVPFNADFNRELLSVKGLTPGQYRLTIDGQEAGSYTAEALASGLNLATNPATPQYKQALAVMATNAACARIANDQLRNAPFLRHFTLRDFKGDWRDFAAVSAAVKAAQQKLPEGDFGRRMCDFYLEQGQEEDARRRQAEALEEEMRGINKPTWHRYELMREL